MAGTLFENAMWEVLPKGYQHTFTEESRLRTLNQQSPTNLGGTVTEYGGNVLTEEDIILREVESVNTQFLTSDQTIEFPGLSLVTDEENQLIRKWASLYKSDNDTPSGTVKDPARAGTDDIVFSFAYPEIWNQIADTDKPDFYQNGLTGGEAWNLVGDAGMDVDANTDDTSLLLDNDEYLFFTGDFIDMSGGQSVVTGTQWSDVDGEDYGPVKSLFSGRLSGAHIITTTGTYATASVDLDAKAYEDGDAELVPIAFYMGPGQNSPGLV